MLSSNSISIAARLRRAATIPTRTELLYLPYHCFEIQLSGSTGTQTVEVVVDALVGDAVFFVGDDLNRAQRNDEVCCEFTLAPEDAREIALEVYRRMLLEHGLRNKTTTLVRDISTTVQLLYPFWIGYIQKGNTYDFKALDAVSGELQGVKMRKVFLRAFRQLEDR